MDTNPLSPGLCRGKLSLLSPAAADPNFGSWLLRQCRKLRINAIIPTTDADLEVLSENRELFLRSGTEIFASPSETIRICNDKSRFYDFFRKHGIRVPAVFKKNQKSFPFPIFIKPCFGRGSDQAMIVRDSRELSYWLRVIERPLLQQYIKGVEYTIDLFLDREGKPVSIVPRERIATRAGVSDIGRTVNDQSLIRFARRVTETLPFLGPINLQCIRRGKEIFLTEINPRFSGGISLTISAGADFAEWTVMMLEGKKVLPRMGKFLPDLVMMVYEQAIYLPWAKQKKSSDR